MPFADPLVMKSRPLVSQFPETLFECFGGRRLLPAMSGGRGQCNAPCGLLRFSGQRRGEKCFPATIVMNTRGPIIGPNLVGSH